MLWEKMEGQTQPLGRELGLRWEWLEDGMMGTCRVSCCGDREQALSSFRELKKGCLEEVALSWVLEGE